MFAIHISGTFKGFLCMDGHGEDTTDYFAQRLDILELEYVQSRLYVYSLEYYMRHPRQCLAIPLVKSFQNKELA